jgi:hypothetical protein
MSIARRASVHPRNSVRSSPSARTCARRSRARARNATRSTWPALRLRPPAPGGLLGGAQLVNVGQHAPPRISRAHAASARSAAPSRRVGTVAATRKRSPRARSRQHERHASTPSARRPPAADPVVAAVIASTNGPAHRVAPSTCASGCGHSTQAVSCAPRRRPRERVQCSCISAYVASRPAASRARRSSASGPRGRARPAPARAARARSPGGPTRRERLAGLASSASPRSSGGRARRAPPRARWPRAAGRGTGGRRRLERGGALEPLDAVVRQRA